MPSSLVHQPLTPQSKVLEPYGDCGCELCVQAAIGNSRRTDDELEQLSIVREPRQRDSSPYNTSKVSLFARYMYTSYTANCWFFSHEHSLSVTLPQYSVPSRPMSCQSSQSGLLGDKHLLTRTHLANMSNKWSM